MTDINENQLSTRVCFVKRVMTRSEPLNPATEDRGGLSVLGYFIDLGTLNVDLHIVGVTGAVLGQIGPHQISGSW